MAPTVLKTKSASPENTQTLLEDTLTIKMDYPYADSAQCEAMPKRFCDLNGKSLIYLHCSNCNTHPRLQSYQAPLTNLKMKVKNLFAKTTALPHPTQYTDLTLHHC